MTVALVWITDLAILLLLAVIGLVVVTGGGVVTIGHSRVSIQTIGNPLFFLLVSCAARYYFARHRPFLGTRALPLDTLDAASLRLSCRLHASLASVPVSRGSRLAVLTAVVALGIRLLNAYSHYGFHTGDDVEIHELTIGRLLGAAWPIWDLRSPFFPMLFIYPAQWAAMHLGAADPSSLVFVGRSVVALFSSCTIVVLFHVGRRNYGVAAALLSTAFLAASHLHTRMGSTELPRPVAAFFVLVAFGLLLRGGRLGAIWGGVVLGIAAALRFSEAIFMISALATLAFERRWRDTVSLGIGFSGAFCLSLGVGDWLFWGTPFFGLRNAIDYTLVQGLSSRGYQPFHYYLTHITDWSDFFTVGLSVTAIRLGYWRPVLWTWLPILTLSFFPHKEARYIVPALPFLALSAGCALSATLSQVCQVTSPVGKRVAMVLVIGAVAAGLFNAGAWRFRRTERSVDLARSFEEQWRHQGLAVEQSWRLGGHIYLRDVSVLVDIPPEDLTNGSYLHALAGDPRISWILLRSEHVDATHSSLLSAAGYAEVSALDPGYKVFRR